MRYSESVVDLIGNTPLVRLRNVTQGLGATVLAKVEYFNPGGSVKDRIAVRMIDAAEESGLLKPGGTIVEPTSGNTGVGLAIVAQQRGYHCIFVCPDKVSGDKINTLRAYGAEVVVCPTAVDPEDPRSYYSVSDRLARETPGGWKPDQYANPGNPQSHYDTTGPELWEQTEGRITHFVAGADPGDEVRDPALGLLPQFRAGRLVVRLRVPRVGVLVGLPTARRLAGQSVRDRVVRPRILGIDRGRADDDLRAVRAQRVDLVATHLVGADEDAVVAPLLGDDRQPHPGVARRGLDNRPARLEQARLLGRVDHADRDPVLHRPARVEVLDLRQDGRPQTLRDVAQAHEG